MHTALVSHTGCSFAHKGPAGSGWIRQRKPLALASRGLGKTRGGGPRQEDFEEGRGSVSRKEAGGEERLAPADPRRPRLPSHSRTAVRDRIYFYYFN